MYKTTYFWCFRLIKKKIAKEDPYKIFILKVPQIGKPQTCPPLALLVDVLNECPTLETALKYGSFITRHHF